MNKLLVTFILGMYLVLASPLLGTLAYPIGVWLIFAVVLIY